MTLSNGAISPFSSGHKQVLTPWPFGQIWCMKILDIAWSWIFFPSKELWNASLRLVLCMLAGCSRHFPVIMHMMQFSMPEYLPISKAFDWMSWSSHLLPSTTRTHGLQQWRHHFLMTDSCLTWKVAFHSALTSIFQFWHQSGHLVVLLLQSEVVSVHPQSQFDTAQVPPTKTV